MAKIFLESSHDVLLEKHFLDEQVHFLAEKKNLIQQESLLFQRKIAQDFKLNINHVTYYH